MVHQLADDADVVIYVEKKDGTKVRQKAHLGRELWYIGGAWLVDGPEPKAQP